jgi:hypothetical protein
LNSRFAAATRCAFAVGAAACLPAAAVADVVETTARFSVRPGPLALYGVPAGRPFTPLIRCTAAGLSAVLPSIRVVDATGSGRGWQLAASVVGGGEAWVRTAVSAYNGPPRMRPHSAGEVRLTERPRTLAFALRDQGMGTTVIRGMSVDARPGVRVRFVLEPGP